MLEISEDEFNSYTSRILFNQSVLVDCIKENKKMLDYIDKVYTYDSVPGEHTSTLLGFQSHDIMPSIHLNALAVTKPSGVDAYRFHKINDKFFKEPIELKSGTIRTKNAFLGKYGAIYIGNPEGDRNARTSLLSNCNASYTCHTLENVESKNMATILFLLDYETDLYIDAWEMDGDDIVNYLKGDPAKKRNIKRTIKMCSFMLTGEKADTFIPFVGIDEWKKDLYEHLYTGTERVAYKNWLNDTIQNLKTIKTIKPKKFVDKKPQNSGLDLFH